MADVFLGSVYASLELRDNNLSRQVSDAKKALSSVDDNGAFQNVTRNINNTTSALGDLAKATASVGWNVFKDGAAAATTTIAAFATKGVKAGSQLEDIRTQLIGLTHSTDEANKAMATTVEFFQNNPFQRGDVAEATKQLMLYGIENKDLMATLKKVGNVALTTGSNIGELAQLYGRASSQSKVMVADLDMIAMKAPGIWAALGKQLGKSAGEVRESVKGVGVDVETFKKAFEDLYDAVASQEFEKTLSRQVDRFKGATQKIAAAMGGYTVSTEKGIIANEQGIMRSFTRFLKAIADETTSASSNWPKLVASLTKLGEAISPFIDKVTENIPRAFEVLTKAVDFLADHSKLLIPILGGAALAFGGLAQNLPGIGGMIGNLTGGIKDMGKALLNLAKANPIVAGLLALFTVGFVKAYKENEEFRKSISNLFSAIGNLGKALMPVIQNLVGAFANLAGSGAVVGILTAVANALAFMANALAKLPEPVLTGIVTALLGLVALKKVISPVSKVGGALGGLTKGVSSLGKASTGIGSGIGNAIASVLKPLGNTQVLKGAASAALAGGALVLVAMALDKAMKVDYNIGKLLAFAACVTAAAGIMALIGTFGVYAAIGGIATAIISGGLLVAALALQEVSASVGSIDLGKIVAFEGMLAVVSAIMAAISGFAVFGAIGGIASGIIGGGLLVAAKCLAEASKSVDDIKMDKITEFSGMLAQVDVILGLIAGFAVFGAVGSVANAIISGGLLVSAIALKETSERVKEIDKDAITDFSGTLATVDVILGLLSGFAVLGAIGAVANDIISGGLLVAAIALKEASKHASEINEGAIDKLNGVVAKTDAILAAMSLLSVFSGIGAVINSVISGGVLVAAKALLEASKYASQLKDSDLNALESMLKKIASWDTGGILDNLKNMINTGILSAVADNVKNVVNNLSGLKPIDNKVIESLNSNIKKLSELETSGVLESIGQMWASGNLAQVASNVRNIINDLSNLPKMPSSDTIDNLKTTIHNLSQIKIEGSGLFENKGGAAEELAFIVWKIVDMAKNLASMPKIDYGKVESNVNAIKLFDRIDDNARNGIRRLNDLGDSLGNINWIKSILGDLAIDYGSVENFVNAVKLFDRIDDNARNGVMRLASMRDALGNIDWIKHILGDIPGDIASRAESLVNAIKKFDGISVDGGNLQNVANALNNLKNTIVNQMSQMINIMRQSGMQSAQNYVAGFQSKIGDARQQGIAMGNALKTGLQSVNNSLRSVGMSAQGQYWSGIQGKMNDEYQQGKALANQLKNGLGAVNMTQSGQWAVQGFINGANSQNVYSTGWQIANRFLQGLKDRGQQGSPWKTTFQSGVWAGEGFADGIEKSEGMVEKAASAIADVAMSAMKMNEFGEMMVSPDMASVSASVAQIRSRVELGENANGETNIYGDIYITPNGDDEDVLDELSRASSMVDRGFATRV